MLDWMRASIRSFLFRGRLEREMREEMAEHLHRATELLVARGLAPGEARRQALREFGNVGWHQERGRDARGTLWLDSWARDFRHAARALARAPMFSAVVVGTLALAIGANASIFSVVSAVLLDPLPFPNADRLVYVGGTAPGTDMPAEFGVPDELYFEYRARASELEELGLYVWGAFPAQAEGHTEQLFLSQATPSLFTALGTPPALGRLPTNGDEDRVVLLSDWLWESWFDRSPDVLGRTYEFASRPRTIIGVMPPEFRFPDERVAYWIPRHIRAANVRPGGFEGGMVARVKPGTDPSALGEQLEPFARVVQERLGGPAPYVQIMERHRPVVRSLHEQLVGRVATPLWILTAAAGILFLIACLNVANLFTVRAESRQHDLAVRRALGAGRAGLIRSQMTEALLLAAAGGAAGTLVAWAAVPLLLRVAPESAAAGFMSMPPVPGLSTARLDLGALGFTAGVSLLAACLFGLLPAVRFASAGLESLRRGGWTIARGRGIGRDALVVMQTASALVLLVGSALLVSSTWRLGRVDPGFETEGVFTFRVAPGGQGPSDAASISQSQVEFMDRLAALQDVESVGFVTGLPLDQGGLDAFLTTSRIEEIGAEALHVRMAGVGGAYFQSMGIELLGGRLFERGEEGGPSAILSQAAADLLFPLENPLGQQFRPVPGDNWYVDKQFTVIGVVEDVRLDDLRSDAPSPMLYLPVVVPAPIWVVKSGRADQIAADIGGLVREVNPDSPMHAAFTMDRVAASTTATLAFTMLMVSIAAALALILGAVGIYGVLSYDVTRRTREIAVRMALGEPAWRVLRSIVLRGGRVALIGVAIGVLAALGTTRFLESLLFGVKAIDPFTFVAAALAMLTIALVASYVPGRRAYAMEPVRSLRIE